MRAKEKEFKRQSILPKKLRRDLSGESIKSQSRTRTIMSTSILHNLLTI
jgi:hypothetical protein